MNDQYLNMTYSKTTVKVNRHCEWKGTPLQGFLMDSSQTDKCVSHRRMHRMTCLIASKFLKQPERVCS